MSDSIVGARQSHCPYGFTHIDISIVTHLMALANYALCIVHCALCIVHYALCIVHYSVIALTE